MNTTDSHQWINGCSLVVADATTATTTMRFNGHSKWPASSHSNSNWAKLQFRATKTLRNWNFQVRICVLCWHSRWKFNFNLQLQLYFRVSNEAADLFSRFSPQIIAHLSHWPLCCDHHRPWSSMAERIKDCGLRICNGQSQFQSNEQITSLGFVLAGNASAFRSHENRISKFESSNFESSNLEQQIWPLRIRMNAN